MGGWYYGGVGRWGRAALPGNFEPDRKLLLPVSFNVENNVVLVFLKVV
jgi:hypothetical protein